MDMVEVEYLKLNDVESLVEVYEYLSGGYDGYAIVKFKSNDKSYTIEVLPHYTNRWQWKYIISDADDNTMFEGYIKNKEELKVILIKLNILQNE